MYRRYYTYNLIIYFEEYKVTSDGWIINKDKQYYFSTDSVPMEKGREFCKKNFGDLAVVDDETERKFLWRYVRKLFIVSILNQPGQRT